MTATTRSDGTRNDHWFGIRFSKESALGFLIRFHWILLVAGVLLRWTLRDSVPILATLYYGTPPIVLCLLAVSAGFLSRLRGERRGATVLYGAGALFLVWHWSASFSYGEREPVAVGSSIQLVLWNVCSQLDNGDGIERQIRQWNPDVLCLLEARSSHRPFDYWHSRYSDYQVHLLVNDMVLLTRLPIERVRDIRLTEESYASRVSLSDGGRSVDLVLVDFVGSPLVPRRKPFDRLHEMIEPSRTVATLLLGDFNTPRHSVFFDRVRKSFDHAFERKGFGFSETWPVPFPVLDIDHIWFDRSIEVFDCRLPWTFVSDHRPVILDFGLSGELDSSLRFRRPSRWLSREDMRR